MNAALRHDRQTVHEAKNLAPPSVRPSLFSQLLEHDGRGHTLLQATELPQKGHSNIRHLPDVRWHRVRTQSSPNLCAIQDRGQHQGIKQAPHHGDRLITHQPFELRPQLGMGTHSILLHDSFLVPWSAAALEPVAQPRLACHRELCPTLCCIFFNDSYGRLQFECPAAGSKWHHSLELMIWPCPQRQHKAFNFFCIQMVESPCIVNSQ